MLLVLAAPYASAAASFADGFESGTVRSVWSTGGDVRASTDRAHAGLFSVLMNPALSEWDRAYADLPFGDSAEGYLRVFFYDDGTGCTGSGSALHYVRISDSASYPSRQLGVGVATGASACSYVLRVGPDAEDTAIARSTGWHEVVVVWSDGRASLRLDETWVISGFDAGTPDILNLGDGWHGGTGAVWYDDVALGSLFADSDSDGLDDGAELSVHHTDPRDADTDDDGLSDGAEVQVHATDPADADSDGDAVGDGEEVWTYGTDPNDRDTDDDGLSDGMELFVTGTDPKSADNTAHDTQLDFRATVPSTALSLDAVPLLTPAVVVPTACQVDACGEPTPLADAQTTPGVVLLEPQSVATPHLEKSCPLPDLLCVGPLPSQHVADIQGIELHALTTPALTLPAACVALPPACAGPTTLVDGMDLGETPAVGPVPLTQELHVWIVGSGVQSQVDPHAGETTTIGPIQPSGIPVEICPRTCPFIVLPEASVATQVELIVRVGADERVILVPLAA